MTNGGASLRVVEVRKTFTTRAEEIVAVDDLSLAVDPGELVCISGTSGSGKSTLLNLVTGLLVPDSGSVTIDDVLVSGASEEERAALRLSRIGVVFQHDNLIEEFTAGENVAFPLELRGAPGEQVDLEVPRLLGLVGLSDALDRHPSQLSGGQQQRVGIARALTGGRGLLVADEPSAALDSATSRALFALLRDLSDQGVTVLLASHDPLAQEHATRVIEMIDGRIHES